MRTKIRECVPGRAFEVACVVERASPVPLCSTGMWRDKELQISGPFGAKASNKLNRPLRGRKLIHQRAFTVIELLVLLSIVTLFGAVLTVGFGAAKPPGQSFQCLANKKQLMLANFMYQAENRERYPFVFHGGGFSPAPSSPVRSWIAGWLDWTSASDNTNSALLVDERYALLGPYLANNASLFKCPADDFVSGIQKFRAWPTRVRSVSANAFVGLGNAWSSDTRWGASGPANLKVYRGAARSSDLLIPGPARTWVYMDEHPDSINDGASFPPDSATNVPDAPATYHNGAGAFALADGHAQMHLWKGPLMTRSRSKGGFYGVNYSVQNNFATTRGDPDLYWFSFSSPRRTTRTVAD